MNLKAIETWLEDVSELGDEYIDVEILITANGSAISILLEPGAIYRPIDSFDQLEDIGLELEKVKEHVLKRMEEEDD